MTLVVHPLKRNHEPLIELYRTGEVIQGKTKVFKKKPVPVLFYSPQIPHRLAGIEPGPPH